MPPSLDADPPGQIRELHAELPPVALQVLADLPVTPLQVVFAAREGLDCPRLFACADHRVDAGEVAGEGQRQSQHTIGAGLSTGQLRVGEAASWVLDRRAVLRRLRPGHGRPSLHAEVTSGL